MKFFKTNFFLFCICLITILSLTVKTYGQSKENANFNAGVAAYNANNLPLAYKKFLAAAKVGHIDSQYNLALMYEKGIGIGKNEKEAVIWYGKAAEQGSAPAQFNLGVLNENGRGTPIDFAKAHKWYRKAAIQGDGLAIGNLGMLYLRGQGVKVNKVAGIALLLLSSQVDRSPENNAKQNITATKGLNVSIITEAQSLSDKMSNSKNILTPLDQYVNSATKK